MQSISGINYATNTWYTLNVSSAGTGLYNLTFFERATTNVLRTATVVSTNAVAGGYVGFYGDVGGTNNYYDNLSASVIAPATYAGGSGQWSTGFATNPTSAQNAVFSGVGGAATNDISSGTLGSVNSLFFRAGAGAYTLSADAGSAGSATNQTLTLSNGIINNSSSAQTVNLALTLNGAQTINAASNNITLGGAVNGTATVTKTGVGILVLTASNTYTGGTVINAGALQLGNGGTTGWLPSSSITNNATFIYNRSDELSLGTVSGTGTVMVNSGTLNTRSGSLGTTNLIINAGVVMGASSGSYGGGNITLGNTNGGSSAATLSFNNNATPTFNNNILLGTTSGALTFLIDTENATGTLTFAGNITGNNSLSISNTRGGTATNLAFSGSVDNAGRINHGGTSTNTTIISGNLGANVTGVTVNSGILALSGTNASFAGDAVVNSGGTLALATNGSLRFVIGGSGTNNAVSGSGTTTMVGQFAFDLTAASTNTNATWTIVANTLTNSYGTNFLVTGFNGAGGLWTNTTNGVNYVFSQASGVLSVQSIGGVTPYNAWVAYWTNVVPGFTNTAGTDNPDGDPFDNNEEFAFDGNPTIGTGALLTAVKVGSNAVFNWTQRTNGVTYEVQKNGTLTNAWSVATGLSISNSTNQNGVLLAPTYLRKEFIITNSSGNDFYRIQADFAAP